MPDLLRMLLQGRDAILEKATGGGSQVGHQLGVCLWSSNFSWSGRSYNRRKPNDCTSRRWGAVWKCASALESISVWGRNGGQRRSSLDLIKELVDIDFESAMAARKTNNGIMLSGGECCQDNAEDAERDEVRKAWAGLQGRPCKGRTVVLTRYRSLFRSRNCLLPLDCPQS